MFGFGKAREAVLHCSECGGRMSRHVAGRCPSSLWDVPADKLRAKQDADVAAALEKVAAKRDEVFGVKVKYDDTVPAGAIRFETETPRKLYGGELLNDLHKRVVALEDKAAVKPVSVGEAYEGGRKDAFDEVEAVVRNCMRNRYTDSEAGAGLSNILVQISNMRAK